MSMMKKGEARLRDGVVSFWDGEQWVAPPSSLAPSTLSERMHGVANGWRKMVNEEDGEFSLLAAAHRMDIEANEVAALEAELVRETISRLGWQEAWKKLVAIAEAQEDSPSAFGYMRHDKSE